MRCDWYKMERSEQLMYQHLLFYAQNPRGLTVGGLLPMNMVTSVSVSTDECYSMSQHILKIVYSFVFRFSNQFIHI